MDVLRIAAFSHKNKGGNPAGVKICDHLPDEAQMLKTAKQVGYSETAFLQKIHGGWRIRYFAPEMEVPFCGHATIAAGAALGEKYGTGRYTLFLNRGQVRLETTRTKTGEIKSSLTSPGTWSEPAPPGYTEQVLKVFNLSGADLDEAFPVRIAFAGAKHLILFVKNRQTLAEMAYEIDTLKALMTGQDLTTVSLIWAASDRKFYSRNPFPTGGVYEDPATGAAAAALGGYLRDIGWQGSPRFSILQGQDMGVPSRISVEFTMNRGEGVKVSGETRNITEP